MNLQVLKQDFSVCKVKDLSEVNIKDEFCFIGKTDEELSVVCDTLEVPKETLERDDHWKAFRICGVLDFSLIGILSKISGVLAEEKIGIFAVSTFNTDYVLTKKENFNKALEALEKAGYTIMRD